MGASSVIGFAIAALALLWLAIAVVIAALAARRFKIAEQLIEAAQANARLLELMPSRPLLVHADHTIEADEQLTRDLGLSVSPKTLAALVGNDSGIAPDDLDALAVQDVSDGGTHPYRVHMRDPSFVNLQAISAMAEGALLADVIAGGASLDPVMGGCDR